MKKFIAFCIKLITKPKKAFEEYKKNNLYLFALMIFLISFAVSLLEDTLSGKLSYDLATLLYVDLWLFLIIIQIYLIITKKQKNITKTLGVLFLINIPTIIMCPLLIVSNMSGNLYLTIVLTRIHLLWKIFLFILGLHIVYNRVPYK